MSTTPAPRVTPEAIQYGIVPSGAQAIAAPVGIAAEKSSMSKDSTVQKGPLATPRFSMAWFWSFFYTDTDPLGALEKKAKMLIPDITDMMGFSKEAKVGKIFALFFLDTHLVLGLGSELGQPTEGMVSPLYQFQQRAINELKSAAKRWLPQIKIAETSLYMQFYFLPAGETAQRNNLVRVNGKIHPGTDFRKEASKPAFTLVAEKPIENTLAHKTLDEYLFPQGRAVPHDPLFVYSPINININ